SSFPQEGQPPGQPPRQPPAQYIDEVRTKAASYSGFNLLVGDGKELWWLSNRDGTPRRLEPGIYGLGNALLDSPDVEPRKRRFEDALAPGAAVEPLFSVLPGARSVNPRSRTHA